MLGELESEVDLQYRCRRLVKRAQDLEKPVVGIVGIASAERAHDRTRCREPVSDKASPFAQLLELVEDYIVNGLEGI